MTTPTTIAEFLTKVTEELGVQPEVRELLSDLAGLSSIVEDAIQGDIVLDISPTTVAPVPTSSAWTRNVVLTLQNAAGETHTWCDMAFTTTLSVGDTSTAGTATIVSTTLTFVNGVATIVVSGDAQDWLDTETDTLTIANMTIMGYTVTGGTSVETFTA